jgi:hypothetical protein
MKSIALLKITASLKLTLQMIGQRRQSTIKNILFLDRFYPSPLSRLVIEIQSEGKFGQSILGMSPVRFFSPRSRATQIGQGAQENILV